jgi:hypothetical protein
MLTGQEFAFLCGEGAKLPADTMTHDWGDGLVYYSADEARRRGLGAKALAAE